LQSTCTQLQRLQLATLRLLTPAPSGRWVLRHWKGSVGRREGPLQLVHVIALGPRERLALVKVGGRYLVVGITPTSINRVSELSDITDDVTDTAKDNVQDIFSALDPGRAPPPAGTG
jgi:flagellar biogenesis protein FliO